MKIIENMKENDKDLSDKIFSPDGFDNLNNIQSAQYDRIDMSAFDIDKINRQIDLKLNLMKMEDEKK